MRRKLESRRLGSGIRGQGSGYGLAVRWQETGDRKQGTSHLLRDSASPTSDLRPLTPRSAFTLVELLVSMAIIAILSGMVMVAVGSAGEAAKQRKTEALVATLNGLMMERYDSYQTRRVPVAILPGDSPQDAADNRLLGIRELMKIEMPDRWSDVTTAPAVLSQRTALSQSYLRRYQQLNNLNASNPTQQHQGAECLYLIITTSTAEGEALSFFSDNDIGDVDNDGAKEFLDGWGKPISFIRWPAGYVSELQPLTPGGVNPITDRDPNGDHDPFDIMRRDPPAYRLVPLIYSAGPDQLFDIETTPGSTSGINPYLPLGMATNLVGTEFDVNGDGDQNWHDNIHNHRLGQR